MKRVAIPPVPPRYARAAVRHLTRIDPVLGKIIAEVGPLRIRINRRRFQALARAIMFQQLAGRAAAAIYTRFVALFPGRAFPTPAQVLAASDDRLRGAGLSRQKMLYLRDLAVHVADGSLNFHRFAAMSDDDVIAELTRVKGIGRWTAEMFLMFNLGRPDVLPLDDLGLRSAVRKAYQLAALPTKPELEQIGERWRPYRTAASWYLWQSTRIVLPSDGPQSSAPRRPRAAKKTQALRIGPVPSGGQTT
jgi:DNA-3-methyladenine glycosylase II